MLRGGQRRNGRAGADGIGKPAAAVAHDATGVPFPRPLAHMDGSWQESQLPGGPDMCLEHLVGY